MTTMEQHTQTLDTICQQAPVIPVLSLTDAEQALGLCQALYAGGLKVLEITLRSDYALSAIQLVKEALPEAIIGAGTVLNQKDYAACIEVGADFIVSPGSTLELLGYGAQASVPLLPGVASISEIMTAMTLGYERFKLFPAAVAGGVPLLKSIYGPLPHIKFCPTGGIKPDNAADFLQQPNVMCVGGTWLTPAALVAQQDWAGIEGLARQAASLRS